MIIEKVVLKVGRKKIELTQDEYEELKRHFSDKEYIPYPIYPQPSYPVWPTTLPTTPWYLTTNQTPIINNGAFLSENTMGGFNEN